MRKITKNINSILVKADEKKPRVSKSAAAAIEARVEDARPRVLTELGWICEDRSGYLTEEQVAAAAAVMSHLISYFDLDLLPDKLGDWLQDYGGSRQSADNWAESPAGAALVIAAVTRPTDRRDLPAEDLRQVFAVSDDEVERLGLHYLAPKNVRDRARRRAEGVMPRGSKPKAEPWKALGISKATYYRQQSRVVAEREGETSDDPINKEVGEPDSETLNDPIAHARASDDDNTYYIIGSFAVSPTDPPPAVSKLPTAEGRRYATLALRLGAKWQPVPILAAPETWFDPMEEDAEEATELATALQEAIAGQRRANSIQQAKEKRKGEKHVPKDIDPQTCPRGIPESMWSQVPTHLRDRVWSHAGLLYLAGYNKIEAVAFGFVAAERAERREAAIISACPDVDPEVAARLAAGLWEESLEDAVDIALDRIAETRAYLTPEIVLRAKEMLAELAQGDVGPDTQQDVQLELQTLLVNRRENWRNPKALVEMAQNHVRWRHDEKDKRRAAELARRQRGA